MMIRRSRPVSYAPVAAALVLFTTFSATMRAQTQNPHAQHAATQASDNQALSDQIQQLREQVANLQAALQKQNPASRAKASTQKSGMAMGGGAKTNTGGNMPMMDEDKMGGMSSGQQSGMPMGNMGEMGGMGMGEMGGMGKPGGMSMGEMGGMSMEGMKNMAMMGDMGEMGGMKSSGSSNMSGMGAMGSMAVQSALPGSPGASHLYHIGATGFFLDHPRHITLTTEQRTRLNQIKQKALMDKATAQRKIDEAEQQLFALTAADQPDQARIEAQIKSIENLRTEQRLAYIRAVGEATQVLTDQQRQALLGKMAAK